MLSTFGPNEAKKFKDFPLNSLATWSVDCLLNFNVAALQSHPLGNNVPRSRDHCYSLMLTLQ